MSAKLITLVDLYVQQIEDLYDACRHGLKSLSAMADAASSIELQQVLQQQIDRAERQLQRLEILLERLARRRRGFRCDAARGLSRECDRLIRGSADPAVLDAALIALAQRLAHYLIAGYGCARAFAQVVGDHASAGLLEQCVQEEGEADRRMTQLAEAEINMSAAAA